MVYHPFNFRGTDYVILKKYGALDVTIHTVSIHAFHHAAWISETIYRTDWRKSFLFTVLLANFRDMQKYGNKYDQDLVYTTLRRQISRTTVRFEALLSEWREHIWFYAFDINFIRCIIIIFFIFLLHIYAVNLLNLIYNCHYFFLSKTKIELRIKD